MRSQRLISMFAIAACGVLLTGGSVAAVTSSTAATSTPAATSAPPARAGGGVPAARGATTAPVSGGRVFFTAYQNDDLPGAAVVLSGAIGDFGAAVSVLRNGMVDPEHSSELNLALTKGSFRIVIGPLHQELGNALTDASFSLRTCSGHAAVTGAAPVVAGSGTGAYKGINGSFKLTITVNEVIGQLGQPCQRWTGLSFGEGIFVAGTGTVSFG